MVGKKINILHLRDSPWMDGPGRTILETGARIDKSKYGYYIGAFCKKNEDSQPFVQAAIERKLNVFRINESHSLDISVLSQIRRLIKNHNIDIVHTHEVRSDIMGLIAGRPSGIPVITTLHGWIGNSFKGRLLIRVDKGILRFFDHVIAVSEKMKEQVLGRGVQQDKLTVLHNALILENYCPDSSDQKFRQEIGVENDVVLICNIGRLSPEKGQADFIRAAALVLREKKEARFVLIGKGDDLTKLQELTRELGIQEKVIFTGFRKDMANVYNSLDLVVQSSHTEGMPNVILEALAMQVPAIATNVGGTSEAIKPEQTGILVEPRNPQQLAAKILEFIGNIGHFKNMSRQGRALVESEFNFDERTRRLCQLYDEIMSRNSHRSLDQKKPFKPL